MNAPTAPYIAILESDSADNDDWITDHAGDPDDIDWSTYTEGTEAIVFDLFQKYECEHETGITFGDLGAAYTYDAKFGKRFTVFTIGGVLNSLADVNYVTKYTMGGRHTTGTDFSRPVLVICQSTGNYVKFHDHNDAAVEYLECSLIKARIMYSDNENQLWKFLIQGRSVWR